MKTLHFSLGPVQDFVAQARKTRDFWVGSFLLSWLTGHAMQAIISAKGKIIFPEVEGDPLMQALADFSIGKQPEEFPAVASLPNRFMAEIPDDFNPEICQKAVLTAWQNIATVVYQKYIEPLESLGQGTRAIWNRQIDGFWEIIWAVGSDRRTLDCRKNWRVHVPSIELGDKCSLMGNLQELSGYTRSASKNERESQDNFWAKIREKTNYDLKPGERLCAVAFVKRMFPSISQEAIFCTVPLAYPSTPSLAIAHWLEDVITNEPDRCLKFARVAKELGSNSERKVAVVQKLKEEKPLMADFLNLDPNCFFASTLENNNLWEEQKFADVKLRRELSHRLKCFSRLPSPFFALLLMDGDRMGRLLSDNADYASTISKALGDFSQKVPHIVTRHNGVCVYAGGDDVFAMLPLEDALPAAIDLAKEYRKAFSIAQHLEPRLHNTQLATISGAIIYSHHSLPLQYVVQEGHKILDEEAKENTGRNSLAIRVLKHSGPNLLWSAPWETVKAVFPLLQPTANPLFSFTTSFLYNIQRQFDFLANEHNLFNLEQLSQVMEAEYIRSGELRGKLAEDDDAFRKQVRSNIVNLLQICQVTVNNNGTPERTNKFKLDGALLIKFLETKGVN